MFLEIGVKNNKDMSRCYFIYFILLKLIILNTTLFAKDNFSNQRMVIKKVYVNYKVLDEWKNPGRFSPVNAFDGNKSTCFAEGNRDGSFSINLHLDKKIKFDEIKIASGFFKSQKIFKLNNRCKNINLYLFNKAEFNKKNLIRNFVFSIKDKFKYQSLKFKKPFISKYFIFQSLTQYKGTKYNDTCISDIQFYYKGKKIPVENTRRIKKQYIKNIKNKLVNFFSDKIYFVGEKEGQLVTFKNGFMKFIRDEDPFVFIPPVAWKVSESKLFMNVKSKWKIVDYYFLEDQKRDLVIHRIGNIKYDLLLKYLKNK